jgi:3-oxoacyl-[acyl-carrier protein] reductase
MQIRFDGKTALVTGAGHGLGRAIALALAELGARTWVTDIDGSTLTETLALGSKLGIVGRAADAADRRAMDALAAEAGTVHILVHSAGGVRGQVGQPVEDVTDEQWAGIVAANLTSAFVAARAVVPAMKRARDGRIVFISSGAGLGVSLTGIQAYASAKAGEIGLTRQLAHELGPFGIRVNSVAPGFIRSNPSSEKQWQSYGADGQARLIERIALRRIGRPDDISNAVLFLVSDRAAWITGQTLSVDGGK